MFLPRKIGEEIKKEIVEGFTKEDTIEAIIKKHGNLQGLSFFYDCCYNTVCQELGINRKKGEEIKPKKVRLMPKRRK